jgi:hypothetical protein
VNHRFVVPALGLVALSATAASAQEVAKGLFIDGYVDTIFTGVNNTLDANGRPVKDSNSTTDFTSEGVLKVGYNIGDKVKAIVVTRSTDSSDKLNLFEAYGTVDAGNGITVSSGKSLGPFGYYSGYATGLTTVNYALTTKLYSVNPVGVWASYAANEKFTATIIIADGLANNSGTNGKPTHTAGADGGSNVSPGIDFVFTPVPEVSLNLEGYIDPNAGADDASGKKTNIATIGFNAQYKKDAWLAAGELISRSTGAKGETADDSFGEVAWALFATYTIPETKIPMAATLQLSQYLTGKTPTADNDALTKVQAALLTNPTGSSQFGLNLEVFYTMDDKNNNANDESASALGVAVEGIYVIP